MRRLGFFKINLTWLLSLFVAFSLVGESWALSRGSLPLADFPATFNDGGSLILAQMRGKPVAKPKRSIRQSAAPRINQPRLGSVRPSKPQAIKPQLNLPRVTLPNPGRGSSLLGRPSSRQSLLSGGTRTHRMLPRQVRAANAGTLVRPKAQLPKAGAGMHRATPPRIAIAGTTVARSLQPRLATNGVGAKPKFGNDNRRSGIRRSFGDAAKGAGVHFRGTFSNPNSPSKRSWILASGRNVGLAVSHRLNASTFSAGMIGKDARTRVAVTTGTYPQLKRLAALNQRDRKAANDRVKFDFTKVGPLQRPAIIGTPQQMRQIGPKDGLQSRTYGRFADVATGKYGNRNSKYLWTIDAKGVNIVKERAPGRPDFKHTNLSSRASVGGEVWFTGAKSVTINAGSGRFGDGNKNVGPKQLKQAAKIWKDLGYNVTVIKFGERY